MAPRLSSHKDELINGSFVLPRAQTVSKWLSGSRRLRSDSTARKPVLGERPVHTQYQSLFFLLFVFFVLKKTSEIPACTQRARLDDRRTSFNETEEELNVTQKNQKEDSCLMFGSFLALKTPIKQFSVNAVALTMSSGELLQTCLDGLHRLTSTFAACQQCCFIFIYGRKQHGDWVASSEW